MILALCATFAAAAGPMLLATNAAGEDTQRMAGLFLGLGSLTCLSSRSPETSGGREATSPSLSRSRPS